MSLFCHSEASFRSLYLFVRHFNLIICFICSQILFQVPHRCIELVSSLLIVSIPENQSYKDHWSLYLIHLLLHYLATICLCFWTLNLYLCFQKYLSEHHLQQFCVKIDKNLVTKKINSHPRVPSWYFSQTKLLRFYLIIILSMFVH